MSNFPRIVVTPPGPKARTILNKHYSLLSPTPLQPITLVIDSAKDCIIRDVDGNEYIDFNSASCIMNLGHNYLTVLEAIKKQSKKLLHHSPTFYSEPVLKLAEKLLTLVPGSFEKKVLYASNESESIESAIKIIKWHTRKHRFLAFTGAQHGTTLGALSLSSNSLTKLKHFFPMLVGVVHTPYPYCYRCSFKQEFPSCNYWCVDFIEDNFFKNYLSREDMAAVFFESIQWVNGCIVPPPDYFRRLKKLIKRYGLLLVDDETFTGIGRTGRWFGIEHWGIDPDIVCVSGALTSGFPLGAVVCKASIMDWEPEANSSLFGGNPIACMVALNVIETLKKNNLIGNPARMGNYLLKRLEEMKNKYSIIGDIRGKGLMIGIEFIKDKDTQEPNTKTAKEIVMGSWKRGLISSRNTGSTLLISPPLSISRELIDNGLGILEESIAEADRE